MRIRQIALVARELAPIEEKLCRVFGLKVAFRDPNIDHYGLDNAVIPVGDTFLEVVAPNREGTTAGRYLERRGGDGGYMILVQSDDIEAHREHIQSLGVRVVQDINLEKAKGTHLHPKDVPGAILSIDAMDPPESWEWAGPDWQDYVQTEVTTTLLGATIQSPNPDAIAHRWSEVLRQPVEGEGNAAVIRLEDTAVRFVPPQDQRGEGIFGVDIGVREPIALIARARDMKLPATEDSIDAAGVRFRLIRGV